jgi:structural maintenance of chromosome 2
MHVKHVILDGFKSYGTRVDVGEFDPHFNAITGFNGSGKSNILDGIIFVLGLSSLNSVSGLIPFILSII